MKLQSLPIIGFLFLLCACFGDSEIPSLQEQITEIDTYLESNNISAFKDVSGVRFTIDSLGSGFTPRIDSKVTFNYTGKLLNGTVFQTSTLSDALVSQLIAGFQIALPLIPNGSKATFYIPSMYGYGSQGQTGIPANSNLIFQIKLKGITVTTAERAQLDTDIAKIDEFLATQNPPIIAQQDTSGLRILITQQGSGIQPTWFNKIKISYSGKLITNGTAGATFFTGTNEPNSTNDSRVVSYIRGFQAGLQLLSEGGKATFYIPSGLGFGTETVTAGSTTIPSNSNLIYEVELIKVYEP
jgi:FKBP-type peptidyl-prolyl cis-trans isomerase FkpA